MSLEQMRAPCSILLVSPQNSSLFFGLASALFSLLFTTSLLDLYWDGALSQTGACSAILFCSYLLTYLRTCMHLHPLIRLLRIGSGYSCMSIVGLVPLTSLSFFLPCSPILSVRVFHGRQEESFMLTCNSETVKSIADSLRRLSPGNSSCCHTLPCVNYLSLPLALSYLFILF